MMAKKKEQSDDKIAPPVNFDYQSFMEAQLNQTKDPRSEAMVEIAKILFNFDKLLMIGRFSKNQQVGILRSFVVQDFFIEYYNKCICDIAYVPIDEPPFYKKTIDHKYPDINEDVKEKYKEFMNKVMAISISEDGLGRSEAISILSNEQKEQGIMDRVRNFVGR